MMNYISTPLFAAAPVPVSEVDASLKEMKDLEAEPAKKPRNWNKKRERKAEEKQKKFNKQMKKRGKKIRFQRGGISKNTW